MRRRAYYAILKELIGFPTVSTESNLAQIDYAEELLDEHGWRTARRYSEAGGKANLLARIGPETTGGIALAGHTDVVPASGQVLEQAHQPDEWVSIKVMNDCDDFLTRIIAAVHQGRHPEVV